jgi:hypothetical protein
MAAAITIGGSGWRIDHDEILIAMKAPDGREEKFGPISKLSNDQPIFTAGVASCKRRFHNELFVRPFGAGSSAGFAEIPSQTPKCISLKLS